MSSLVPALSSSSMSAASAMSPSAQYSGRSGAMSPISVSASSSTRKYAWTPNKDIDISAPSPTPLGSPRRGSLTQSYPNYAFSIPCSICQHNHEISFIAEDMTNRTYKTTGSKDACYKAYETAKGLLKVILKAEAEEKK